MRRAIPFTLVLAAFAALAAAAEEAPADSSAAEGWLRLIPPRITAGSLVYLPKLYYSSLTGLGAGGQLLHPFRLPGTRLAIHDSDLRASGRITVKGQAKLELGSTLNWDAGRWALRFKLGYDTLPTRYYGIGPDTPTSAREVYRTRSLRAYAEIFRELLPGLRLGLRGEIEEQHLLSVEDGGLLAASGLRGLGDENVVGAGLVFELDRRDRRFSPSRGYYWQGFALLFDDELGSDLDFNNYHLDLRNYFPLPQGSVLATQFFVYVAKGEPPFWRYASMGGRAHSRGFARGRFLDRVLVAYQGELRSPRWRRLGAYAFAGLADVAATPNQLQGEHMKTNAGGGLSLRVGGRGIVARAEIAVGALESIRVDLALDEAF